jgi:soluble lytic murein transglycosylase-like protein
MCLWLTSFTALAVAQTAAPPAATPGRTSSAIELMRAAVEKQRASIAAQQEAIRKQAQSAGAALMPWSSEGAVGPPCDPIAEDVAAPLIENAARANQLPAKLVHAVIEQESGFRPCAVSSKGAQGLMQLMPDTAGELHVQDVFDPRENIAAGARYLKQLLDKYKGDNKLALAAYNAGAAAVDAANGSPDIPETRDYVEAILKKIK